MIQLCAVMPPKDAVKLGVEWKPGRSNGFTQTMTRVFATEAELRATAGKLRCLWAIERPGA